VKVNAAMGLKVKIIAAFSAFDRHGAHAGALPAKRGQRAIDFDAISLVWPRPKGPKALSAKARRSLSKSNGRDAMMSE